MSWSNLKQNMAKAVKAVRSRIPFRRLDQVLGRLGERLFAPLRWIGRLARRAGDWWEDFSLFDQPWISRCLDWWRARLRRLTALPIVGGVVRICVLPFTWLGDLLQLIGQGTGKVITVETPSLVPEAVARQQSRWAAAVRSWWIRHKMGIWLKASPAIAGVGGWIFLGVLVWLQTPAKVEAKYTKWADDAQMMGNFPRARVASERLIQLGGTNQPANILRLAKSLASMGFADEALALADTVASQAAGYGPARLFIAEAIVDNPGANSNALQHAERHLLRAYQADPASADAEALLGRYYYRAGDWEEARWYLKRAFPQRHDAAFTLATIELNLRNELAAVRWAGEAAEHYKAETLKNKRHWRNRLFWAESELIRGNYTNTLDILKEGIQRGDVKIFNRMAGAIYADLLKRSLATDPTNVVEHFDLARQGLNHDALNDFLLQHAARLSRTPPVADQARSFLRELARAQENRGLITFYQGMVAFLQNDLGQARIFFEAAYAKEPENVTIANNYAYILAISEPPDPARGLKLIDQIVAKHPEVLVFRETRGQIYARMGQWQSAVADFETALPFFKSNAVFHASLAKAYSQLGKADKSAEHQRIAEALKAAAEKR